MLNDIRESEGNRREWIVEVLKDIDGMHKGYLHKGELVRCKECKHRYVEEQSWGEYNEFCDFWCDGNGYWASVNADDYCSYGEREGE